MNASPCNFSTYVQQIFWPFFKCLARAIAVFSTKLPIILSGGCSLNQANNCTKPFEICCDFCFPGTLWCLDGRNTITLVNYAHDDYKFLDLYSFLKYMILLFLG